jgi:hypothetical protein
MIVMWTNKNFETRDGGFCLYNGVSFKIKIFESPVVKLELAQ